VRFVLQMLESCDNRVEGGTRDFKGSQFDKEIILWGVRWDVAYEFVAVVLRTV
jgi:hypothetical protein